MGVNLDLVKKKLDKLNNRRSRSDRIWKPDPGKQTIRIIPYKYNKEFPFIELYFHYNFPGPSYLSPYSFGDRDPIVEFAQEIKAQGGQDNYETWKKLMPKRRTFAPIIVRGEEDEGVKYWGFGKMIYEQLLNVIYETDITDPQTGCDLKIEYIPKAQSNTQFPKTNLTVIPRQCPITEDRDKLKKWFDEQVEITEVFTVPSEETLQDALDRYLNPEDGDSDDSVTASENGSSNDDSSVDDISDEFAELFDD